MVLPKEILVLDVVGSVHDELHVRWWGSEELPPQFMTWKTVFEKYAEAHFDFYNETSDVAWWYKERPNISVLAGAVWRGGGVAFEEFLGTKDRGHGAYSGRFDGLFILDQRAYIAEAKHHWLRLRSKDRPGGMASAAERAKIDAAALVPYKNHDYRTALLFTSPLFPVKWAPKIKATLLTHRKDEYEALTNKFSMGFRVDLYPTLADYPAFADGFASKGHLHPGITLHLGLERIP